LAAQFDCLEANKCLGRNILECSSLVPAKYHLQLSHSRNRERNRSSLFPKVSRMGFYRICMPRLTSYVICLKSAQLLTRKSLPSLRQQFAFCPLLVQRDDKVQSLFDFSTLFQLISFARNLWLYHNAMFRAALQNINLYIEVKNFLTFSIFLSFFPLPPMLTPLFVPLKVFA
jgi:hypothetical protein